MKSNNTFKQSGITTQLRVAAFHLVLALIFQLSAPTISLALSGGPSQPEVQSFEPVGTSDMVDFFSGDFTYNLPLLDIDGYPINMSYHSGITPDMEASWVGLGWNINAGVVNRSVRGLPDDFSGDIIKKEFNVKENKTFGLTLGGNVASEVIGFDLLSGFNASLSASLGIKFNNYNGYSATISLTPGLSAGDDSKLPLNTSLGISASSDEGASIQPSVGMNFIKTVENTETGVNRTMKGTLTIGGAYSSRGGLKALTVSAEYSDVSRKKVTDAKGVTTNQIVKRTTNPLSASSSWNIGAFTFIPSGEMNYKSLAFSGRFSVGGEVAPAYAGAEIQGYQSKQTLESKSVENHAYGYINSHKSVNVSDLLDYNRENDGRVSEFTPNIALTNFTYDMFAVSGQGTGGSYRSVRGDIGTVRPAYSQTTPAENVSVEVELGVPLVAKLGGSLGYSRTTSTSGPWTNGNPADGFFKFRGQSDGSLYEPAYFKEANEKSVDPNPDLFAQTGGYEAVRIPLKNGGQFNKLTHKRYINSSNNSFTPSSNRKKKREKRNNLFSYLTNDKMNAFAVNALHEHLCETETESAYEGPGHHIGEITNLGSDGSRYVYGLPAYNTLQREFSFAVGPTSDGSATQGVDPTTGYISHSDQQCSNGNLYGRDNYFSMTETPPFAHAFLLTSVLSSDYVDSDAVRGPSDGDFGSYTKFEYEVVKNYRWRSPHEHLKANFNAGLLSDPKDDKASVIYGEKDLYYLNTIITKNYIAKFILSNRRDGRGVESYLGGVDTDDIRAMKKLDAIVLYAKQDYLNDPVNAVPIKTVHFEYDYSLCPGIPNHIPGSDPNSSPGNGKLTLKRVYFTYQNSKKAEYNSYVFHYCETGNNYSYNMKDYDRWGNYQPNDAPADYNPTMPNYPNNDYPYTKQPKTDEEKANTHKYASAWCMNRIELPSGGEIRVEYESDTYSTVQHKKAMEMVPIVGVVNNYTNNPETSNTPSEPSWLTISDQDESGTEFNHDKNSEILFKLESGYTVDDYLKVGDYLFYKNLVPYWNGNGAQAMEYVPGYAKIKSLRNYPSDQNPQYGCVELMPMKLKKLDGGETEGKYNPMALTAVQFFRMNLPRLINDFPSGDGPNLKNALIAIANAIGSVKELFKNPNRYVYDKGIGKDIISHKSMIRVNVPSGKKYGGGLRVKKIESTDGWDNMTGGELRTYGQTYQYESASGESWGVASYEPQIGGEENPWKQPIFYTEDQKGIPDERYMQETPIGESFFPSASVGYSKVIVSNIPYIDNSPGDGNQSITRHATGHVEHEFYTARDFPTLVQQTPVDRPRDRTSPASLSNILKINVRDFLTVSQGFAVETNDMHGKPKSQKVFAEGQSSPISSVLYQYKSEAIIRDGVPCQRLINECSVIKSDGIVQNNTRLGVFTDVINDCREQRTRNESYEIKVNADVTMFFGVTLPSAWPDINYETTQFRSISTTKVIQRFGILENTIATEDGSVVSTKNLCFDAETGEVLLTETVNNFDDRVYTLNYPAYWHYREMGPAYQNLGFKRTLHFDNAGKANVSNALSFYAEGDEISIDGSLRAWIIEVTSNFIVAVDREGAPIQQSHSTVILRSGFRNMQLGSMASITTLSNPLNSVVTNIYAKVLQASAIEYINTWPTVCDCFDEAGLPLTQNPYVLGIKGYWKPTKSYLHLTERLQSNAAGNSNLREDGVFASYNPFYKRNTAGKWEKDYQNWTYTSEVTKFSPYGQELENRDALGRYSAAQFGYRQTLPTAVAANAMYNEIGFDSFEDRNPDGGASCSDSKFKIAITSDQITDEASHTGKYSVKLNNQQAGAISTPPIDCEVGPCELQSIMSEEGANHSIVISGGTAPYNVTWQVQYGTANVTTSFQENGQYVLTVIGDSWHLLINCTDASGESISTLFHHQE
jgi:hypothetical protein